MNAAIKTPLDHAAAEFVRSDKCCVMDTYRDHEDTFKAGAEWQSQQLPPAPDAMARMRDVQAKNVLLQRKVEELEAQLAEAKEFTARKLKELGDIYERHIARKKHDEIAAIEGAIQYLKHKDECKIWNPFLRASCDCGLLEAAAKLRERLGEKSN